MIYYDFVILHHFVINYQITKRNYDNYLNPLSRVLILFLKRKILSPKTEYSSPGGERGIRTLEDDCSPYTLSRRASSTTPAPLHN
jgi:hypothetical protein